MTMTQVKPQSLSFTALQFVDAVGRLERAHARHVRLAAERAESLVRLELDMDRLTVLYRAETDRANQLCEANDRLAAELAQARRIIARLWQQRNEYRAEQQRMEEFGRTAAGIILDQKLRIIELTNGEEE